MKAAIKDEFAAFIVSKWHDGFYHSYSITSHSSWIRWRAFGGENSSKSWHCSSIRQAAARYSWTGENAATTFENLSSHLRTAVRQIDESAAHEICLAIFKWGGVGRKPNDGSVLWLQRRIRERKLCEKLQKALALLTNMGASLEPFNGDELLMNSAMTKVYAALDPSELIIYDGRVGAALGLLAKDYLKSIDHHDAVPDALAFPWGASRGGSSGQPNKRDPSEENFVFPRLFQSSPDRLHAEMMRDASDLLRQVAAKIVPSCTTNLANLERALFMIGYDVSRSSETEAPVP